MKQDSDVILRHSEQGRDVVTRSLFEKAERHDRTLDFAELGDAGAQAHGVFGSRQELLLKHEVAVDEVLLAELGVRASAKMAASLVSSGVSNDGHEDGRRVGAGVDLTRLQELEQRAERVLHAIHGFFGREPFLPGDSCEPPALPLRDAREPLEHVVARDGAFRGRL
jgi:hypothetical protein